MTAAHIMTTGVVTLSCKDSMKDAVKLIKERNIRQIPVVDEKGRVMGVITPRTIMRAILPKYIAEGLLADVRFAPELPQFVQNLDALADKGVCDFLEKDFVKVLPETSSMEVAVLFISRKKFVESILVVDNQGRLLGIISPWDVFKRLCEYAEKK